MWKKLTSIYNLNYFTWNKNNLKNIKNNSRIIKTEKGDVEYSLAGDGDNLFVAIHGTPGNFLQTEYLFHGLKKNNLKFLSWSRPGYSRTPLLNNNSLDEQTEVLKALLDTLNIKTVTIGAFSCGAPYAINFTLKYPSYVNTLILDSPAAFKIDLIPSTLARKVLDFMAFSNLGGWLINIFHYFNSSFPFKLMIYSMGNHSPKEIKVITKQLIKNKAKTNLIYKSILAPLYPFNLIKKGYKNDIKVFRKLKELPVNKIKAPTLIIHGTKDKNIPFEHSVHLAKNMTNAKLLPIVNGTHLTMLTAEKKIIDAKNLFLNKHLYEN
jgi:2-hydroxy-6-oxonona-2,4-dienedioate hydrolase